MPNARIYGSDVANEQVGEAWAAWLREQFDRHRTIRKPADLVRASGTKGNGRPHIDASRVTSWLRGQRPSFELALLAADAFGADEGDALVAAGYAFPGTGSVGSSPQDAERNELPVGSGVDPELLVELAKADPAAIEAVRAVLKAARRGD